MNNTKRKLTDKLSKKERELQEVESNFEILKQNHALDIAARQAEIKTLSDIIKILPSDGEEEECRTIRPSSKAGMTQALLKDRGEPMHIKEILPAIDPGKENNTQNRASLAGTLRSYVSKHEVFKLTAPNTFALIEWGDNPPGKTSFNEG